MQKPLIVVTISYAVGILLGRGLLYFPTTLIVLFLLTLIGLLASLLLRRVTLTRFLLTTLPAAAGALAYLLSAVWTPATDYTRLVPDDDTAKHVLTGRIVSALDRDPDRTGFVVSLHTLDSATASGKVRVSVREAVTHVGYGDIVRLTGKLFEPQGFRNPGGFDYAAHLAQSGISRMVALRDASGIEVLGRGSGLFRQIQDWREQIRQAFRSSLSGQGSAILQAMVLGEEGDLTDDVRDRFMAAGVTHIISISGSHLGMLAVLCFGLMRVSLRLLPERRYLQLTLATDPKKIAALMALPLVIFYTLLAGGQMATVRSLIMLSTAMAALLLDRDDALLHALALAALSILILSPQALFDLSFQLSFISVWIIGSVVLVWNELQIRQMTVLGRAGKGLVLLVIISLSTAIATGPLVARYFNQVSFAGLFANILVVPFAGMLVVPAGLLCGILSLFLGHLPLAGLNQLVANLFLASVSFFAGLPFSQFSPPSPGIIWLFCYTLFVGSLFVLFRSWLLARFKPFENPLRPPRGPLLLVAASALALGLLSIRALLPSAEPEVYFPDVGQGDAAVITLPGGKNILIDGGGTYDDRFDVGRRVLAPFLWNRGIRKLDLVVLSHPHPDHMNGLLFILNRFEVRELWTHGLDTDLPGHADLLRLAAEKHVIHIVRRAVDPPVILGPAELTVLHPAASFRSRERKGYAAENDRSLVFRVALAGRVLLFTGDIGRGAEAGLIRAGKDVKCDLIKVPHHGSKSSSSAGFVRAAAPAVSVFTVGKKNRYRHPADEVVEEYIGTGSRVLRTDRDGGLCIALCKDGLRDVRWNDREIMRIGPSGSAATERENWKRVWIRRWEL